MGIYLNPDGEAFEIAVQSDIYVDKTRMLAYLNSIIGKEQRFVCVSRPRRFGKSMAANMVSAYYSRQSDARRIFAGLAIMRDESFLDFAGKYDVIQLNMQDFLSASKTVEDMISLLERSVLWDLLKEYPDFDYFDKTNLVRTMADVYQNARRRFVIVIDEWDCVFREYKEQEEAQRLYLDFLRTLLKDKPYIGLAYMTGILPIKKYGTHSALNMFSEFSMENPWKLAEFVGFTGEEVRELCRKYGRSYEECRTWYDGYAFPMYNIGEVYNPRSVVCAIESGVFDTYWNQTESFEALKIYIDLNLDGLRDSIIALMSGESIAIDTGTFIGNMTDLKSKDDVLALLVHLGYLGYNLETKKIFIPNQEIRKVYADAVRDGGWGIIAKTIAASENLLEATLQANAEAVAKGIEAARFETSHLQYNDENALAYTISLAYYTARQKYIVVREFPTGKGFADLVFIPRPAYANLPAMIIELKWNRSARAAIEQIKDKEYVQALDGYTGKILLVGVNYDKSTRLHSCEIDEWSK
ncbi:MAG: AAA family ATPase [Selenomonas ruminantium]|nr:AAA family ATPase [Selenomonas ruminantium]